MPDTWNMPKIDGLLAVYETGDDTLSPVDGSADDAEQRARAQQTLALWQIARQIPGAAMMILKTPQRVSLGLANGGLIVEGRVTMNLGLVRAATRKLPAQTVEPAPLTAQKPGWTPFQTTLWNILTRLDGTYLPRTFSIDIGGAMTRLSASGGTVLFLDGETTPEGLVAALRRASEAGAPVSYALAEHDDGQEGPRFTAVDILRAATGSAADAVVDFDATGWPMACPAETDFQMMATLSALAVGLVSAGGDGAPALTVLSAENAQILSAKGEGENRIRFSLTRAS